MVKTLLYNQNLLLLCNFTADITHLMNYILYSYLKLVNLGKKVACVQLNNIDVFTLKLDNFNKLNSLTLLIAWSNEKWVKLTKADS